MADDKKITLEFNEEELLKAVKQTLADNDLIRDPEFVLQLVLRGVKDTFEENLQEEFEFILNNKIENELI